MKKTSLLSRIVAVSLLLVLTLSLTAAAAPAWVAKYEKTIRSNYKSGRFDYVGLVDLGTDGDPEMFLISGKGKNQKLNFYYLTSGGSVRKSSKSIPLSSDCNVWGSHGDFCYIEITEHSDYDGMIMYIHCDKGLSKTKYQSCTYVLSQNSRKTLWLQNLSKVIGKRHDDKVYSCYFKGKKYSEERHTTLLNNFYSQGIEPFDYLDPMYCDSLSEAIAQFRADAQWYY